MIQLITLERFLKAAVLIAGSLALLVLDRHSGAHQAILSVQSEYNPDAGRGLWHRLVSSLLDHAAGVPNRQRWLSPWRDCSMAVSRLWRGSGCY